MALLRVIKGPNPGHCYELDEETVLIGRNPECQVVLDHDAVSRPHARIELEGGEFYIEDLNSLNGTLVNGVPVSRGHEGRRRLQDGDRIKICGFQLYFDADPSSRSSMVLMTDGDDARVMSTINVTSDSSDLTFTDSPESRLRAVLRFSKDVTHALELREALPKVLDGLFRVFRKAQRGFIALRDEPEGNLTPRVAKNVGAETGPIRVSRTIVQQAMEKRSALLFRDTGADERLRDATSVADLSLRSVMCAPLLDMDDEVMGVVELDVVEGRDRFTDEDLKVLAGVARQVAIAIENATLHEVKLRQQRAELELERIERDMQVAREVQRGLLPGAPPPVQGYRFFDVYRPAEAVGGDYYDYIFLPDDRLAVVVADVSGEGVPASLMMARFAGDTRHCLASERDPTRALARLNESITPATTEGRFITLAAAIVEWATHRVTIVNAGHHAPLLCHPGGEVVPVTPDTCFPLGWFEDAAYFSRTIELAPGECLVMFTDGIHEAKNAMDEMYGMPRVLRALGQYNGDVRALGQSLFDDVRRFAGECAQADDMCLLCFGRDG